MTKIIQISGSNLQRRAERVAINNALRPNPNDEPFRYTNYRRSVKGAVKASRPNGRVVK